MKCPKCKKERPLNWFFDNRIKTEYCGLCNLRDGLIDEAFADVVKKGKEEEK